MNKLIIILLMFLSFNVFADNDKNTCNIRLNTNEISYDTLTDLNTRKQGTTLFAGIRLVSVNIECKEETTPYIDFSVIGNISSNYRLDNSSEVLLEANDAMLDGQPVLIDFTDLNTHRVTTAKKIVEIKPGSRIQPEKNMTGKLFTFNLLVDLKINTLDKKGKLIRNTIPLVSLGSSESLSISYSEMSTACNLIVDSTSIDYGIINRNSLKNDSYTLLPEKKINFVIQCDSGKTAVALQARNQIEKSLAPYMQEGIGGYGIPPITLLNSTNMMAGGLGLSAEGIPIGGYALALDSTSLYLDEQSRAIPISSNAACGDSNKVWQKNSGNLLSNSFHNMILSWTKEESMQPSLFSSLKGVIRVQAFINKASLLHINKSINFKGRSIIEICYL